MQAVFGTLGSYFWEAGNTSPHILHRHDIVYTAPIFQRSTVYIVVITVVKMG